MRCVFWGSEQALGQPVFGQLQRKIGGKITLALSDYDTINMNVTLQLPTLRFIILTTSSSF